MLKNFLITVELWAVGRFVPALIQSLVSSNDTLSNTNWRIVLFLLFLPISWALAKGTSAGKHKSCITVNLILFFIIEASSIFQLLSYIIRQDSYAYFFGMRTSDFQIFTVLSLFFVFVYCGVIIWMIKSTPSVADENEAGYTQENTGILIHYAESPANENANNKGNEIACEIGLSPEEPSNQVAVSDTDDSIEIENLRLRFCRKCGFELLSDSAFCSKCGTPTVPPIPKCPSCRKVLTDESVFCHYCGKKV